MTPEQQLQEIKREDRATPYRGKKRVRPARWLVMFMTYRGSAPADSGKAYREVDGLADAAGLFYTKRAARKAKAVVEEQAARLGYPTAIFWLIDL